MSEEGYSGGREVQGTDASGCKTKGVEGEFKKSIMKVQFVEGERDKP